MIVQRGISQISIPHESTQCMVNSRQNIPFFDKWRRVTWLGKNSAKIYVQPMDIFPVRQENIPFFNEWGEGRELNARHQQVSKQVPQDKFPKVESSSPTKSFPKSVQINFRISFPKNIFPIKKKEIPSFKRVESPWLNKFIKFWLPLERTSM